MELWDECTDATGQDTEARARSLKRRLGRCCMKQTLKIDPRVWLGAVTSTEEPWGSSVTVMANPSGLPCLSVHSSQKPRLDLRNCPGNGRGVHPMELLQAGGIVVTCFVPRTPWRRPGVKDTEHTPSHRGLTAGQVV